MDGIETPIIFWGVLLLQLFGLLSALAARIAEGRRAEKSFQRNFFAALVLLSSATLFTYQHGNACWPFLGGTLAMMAVAATLEVDSTAASGV